MLDDSVRKGRIQALSKVLRDIGFDNAIISGGGLFTYLIGVELPVNQRLTALWLKTEVERLLVLTSVMQSADFVDQGMEIRTWKDDSNAVEELASLLTTAAAKCIGVNDEFGAYRSLELKNRMHGREVRGLGAAPSMVLSIKDSVEIGMIKSAVDALEESWTRTLGTFGPITGRSELDLAKALRENMHVAGIEKVAWVDVAAGGHAASPLHHGCEKRISRGECVTIDFAGSKHGYYADLCRTVVAGEAAHRDQKLYEITYNALETVRSQISPGVVTGRIHDSASQILSTNTYGAEFTHRLGHGIGLAPQEYPSLEAGNSDKLAVGNALAIEPGLYIPGQFGCRLEDNGIVTERGFRSLSNVPQRLLVV